MVVAREVADTQEVVTGSEEPLLYHLQAETTEMGESKKSGTGGFVIATPTVHVKGSSLCFSLARSEFGCVTWD